MEVDGILGADRYDGTVERLGYRIGYRRRTLATQLDDLALQIP